MEKLDAKFYGVIRKAKDDSIVPDDEWCCFLAKDQVFHDVIYLYRARLVVYGADEEQVAAIDRMIARIEKWRAANPDRLKVPDAKGEKLLDE